MSRFGRSWMIGLVSLGGIVVAGRATKAWGVQVGPRVASDHSVTFPVSITPNGSVPLHVSCTFTANVSGGTPPYHYAWKVQNVAYGSDSPTISYSSNGGGFHVEVNVTDANSDTGYDSNIMTTGGSRCGV